MEGAGGLDQTQEPSEPAVGWVAEEVRAEFPELRLLWLSIDGSPGRSPAGVKQRLRELSNRFRGAQAVVMRQQPIPWAYRVFYRQIGLDPDTHRTPVEAAAVERLLRGAFKSENLLDDALTIALVETGVPIWALDAASVEGALGLRLSEEGEHLGSGEAAPGVSPGRLVVADERLPLAVLFGEVAPGHGVTRQTTRMSLFSVQVPGVPSIHVDEAIYTCVEVVRSG
jgi:DNA/RNA-binding domain of Phe-tRNA-synthetase-like protein